MNTITRQSPSPEVAAPPRRVALAAALAVTAALTLAAAPPASAGNHECSGQSILLGDECTFDYSGDPLIFVGGDATGAPWATIYVEARDEDDTLLVSCFGIGLISTSCHAEAADPRVDGRTLTCRGWANLTGTYYCSS